MSDERCDRDRVTAILTLADGYTVGDVSIADWASASRSETPWLARRLLEALDTVDRLEGENATKVDCTGTCDWGSCDVLTVAVVQTRAHGWLSVCRHHALQALVPTNHA